MKSSNEITVSQLSSKFNLEPKTVTKILTEAKLKPLLLKPYGRGYTRFYNESSACGAMRKYIDNRNLSRVAVRIAPTPVVALDPIESLQLQIAKLHETVMQMFEHM